MRKNFIVIAILLVLITNVIIVFANGNSCNGLSNNVVNETKETVAREKGCDVPEDNSDNDVSVEPDATDEAIETTQTPEPTDYVEVVDDTPESNDDETDVDATETPVVETKPETPDTPPTNNNNTNNNNRNNNSNNDDSNTSNTVEITVQNTNSGNSNGANPENPSVASQPQQRGLPRFGAGCHGLLNALNSMPEDALGRESVWRQYLRRCAVDTDSDGIIDDNDNCPLIANPLQEDLDEDGFGDVCDDDADGDTYLESVDDCNDLNAGINPGATEIPGNGVDENCDGVDDVDSDGDGIYDAEDNCRLTPNAGQEDLDSDGSGDACDPDADGDGYLESADDCNDLNADINPGATEIPGNGVDENCDGVDDVDSDGDGVYDMTDNCPNIANSGQEDLDGDGIGDVCDDDADGDGYLESADDCNDLNADINPGATEIPGNGVDENCDGVDDVDSDGDGVYDMSDNCPNIANSGQEDLDGDGSGDVCDNDADGDTYLESVDDCDDMNAGINPGATEIPGNGVDENCDGVDDVDSDGDGVYDMSDNCPNIANSGQEDLDGDGIGDVCDDDADGDTYLESVDDCNDLNASINPGATEIPGNGVDENCDGFDVILGTGELQITLSWTGNQDMDLHVREPSGELIYFGNRTSATGGQLDVDAGPLCPPANLYVENIYWLDAPDGNYIVYVDAFGTCGGNVPEWTLTVRLNGDVVYTVTRAVDMSICSSIFNPAEWYSFSIPFSNVSYTFVGCGM